MKKKIEVSIDGKTKTVKIATRGVMPKGKKIIVDKKTKERIKRLKDAREEVDKETFKA